MSRLSRHLPLLLCFLVPLGVLTALCWPLPIRLHDHFHPSIFGPSHVWVGDHLWQVLTHGEALSPTFRAGYPWPREARFIGWLPMLATLPLRPFLGPLTAFHLAELLALPLSALACWPLVRRWTGAEPWSTSAACVAFALCPFALGTFTTGELPKLAIGLLPLFLYALDRAVDREGGVGWFPAAAVLALVTAFTSPYFGLCIPMLTAGLLAVVALRTRRWLRPLAAGALVAASLVPAWLYYGATSAHPTLELFMPALAGGLHDTLPAPHPVASLVDLLLGLPAVPETEWDTRHVPYLGSLAILALLGLALWRRRARSGRWAGVALLVAGAALALGPRLYLHEAITPIPLPASLLGALNYPLASGGMYYRLAVLGSLGLALWLAAELARHPRWAWALLALQVTDSVRASGPWPLPVKQVGGAELLVGIRGPEGAVLELPVASHLVPSQQQLLRAALHGHPTTSLPRLKDPDEFYRSKAPFRRALSSPVPAVQLRLLGVRWVIATESSGMARLDPWSSLGQPTHDLGEFAIWDLGPTELRGRDAAELTHKAHPSPRGPDQQRRPPDLRKTPSREP